MCSLFSHPSSPPYLSIRYSCIKTLKILKRFVEPLGLAAGPRVFTLTLRALQMHDEVDEALRLFHERLQARQANPQHLTVLLDLLRHKFRPGYFRAPSGSRIQQGLEMYEKCLSPEAGPSMAGASGSIFLANATLVLLNSATAKMLRASPHWLEAARGIFARFRAHGVTPNPAMHAQLIMITAKSHMPSEALRAAREVYEAEAMGSNHFTLNAMTFAALEAEDYAACQELYEAGTRAQSAGVTAAATAMPADHLQQYQAAFGNYVRACIECKDVEKGLAAMEQRCQQGNLQTLRGKLYTQQLSQLTQLLALSQALEPKQQSDWSEWQPGQTSSPRVYPSAELKRLQNWATNFLTDLVVATLPSPHLVRDLPLWVLCPSVSAHVLFIGHLDALLTSFPRPSDYVAADRVQFLVATLSKRRGASLSTPVQAFWAGLAGELERQGRWRDLLSLSERLHYLEAVPARDRLTVLGHTLAAISQAGRQEHCRRLLETSGVGGMLVEARRRDEEEAQSPPQATVRQHQAFICKWIFRAPSESLSHQESSVLVPLIFDFLLKQGCTSPRALNQALRRCTNARQILAVLALMHGLLKQGATGRAQYDEIVTNNVSKHLFYIRRALGSSTPREVDDVARFLGEEMGFDVNEHPVLLAAKCTSLAAQGSSESKQEAGKAVQKFLFHAPTAKFAFEIMPPLVMIRILCEAKVAQKGAELLLLKSKPEDIADFSAALRVARETLGQDAQLAILQKSIL